MLPPEAVAAGAGLEVGDIPVQNLFPQPDDLVVIPDFSQRRVLDVSEDIIPEEVLGAGQDCAIPEDDQGLP